MRRFVLGMLLAGIGLVAVPTVRAADATEGLTPQQLLMQARSMFPRERMEVKGELSTAKARGLDEVARPFELILDWSGGVPKATCRLFREAGGAEPLVHAELTRANGVPSVTLVTAEGGRVEGVRLNTPIGESDLTWMDLAFDYLWWPNVRRPDDKELTAKDISTRQNGRNCIVLEASPPSPIPGLSAVRVWVDRSTGNLLQSEQLDEEGRAVRQLFVQRIGRENGRWVPREFRVRRKGAGRITRLRVGQIRSADFTAEEE